MPHGFVQSHIGERRLPHVPYKLELKTHVYHYYMGFSSRPPISRYCPLWLMPHGFVQAYKAHVGVVVVHMCLELKLIRHMWEASLPDVGLNKSVTH